VEDPAITGAMAVFRNPGTLDPIVREVLAKAIPFYLNANTDSMDSHQEIKALILVGWSFEVSGPSSCLFSEAFSGTCFFLLKEKQPKFLCHLHKLLDLVPGPCTVEVRGSPRQNAQAKDSQWVRDRLIFETTKGVDVNEVLLSDEDRVFEGLSSNFFCVKNGTLFTAPREAVLRGTIQGVVEQICERERIPVVGEFPLLSQASVWEGAFLTSTSRLVLPIGCLRIPEMGYFTLPFPAPSVNLTSPCFSFFFFFFLLFSSSRVAALSGPQS